MLQRSSHRHYRSQSPRQDTLLLLLRISDLACLLEGTCQLQGQSNPAEGPAQPSGAGPHELPRLSLQSKRSGFRCVGLREVSNT